MASTSSFGCSRSVAMSRPKCPTLQSRSSGSSPRRRIHFSRQFWTSSGMDIAVKGSLHWSGHQTPSLNPSAPSVRRKGTVRLPRVCTATVTGINPTPAFCSTTPVPKWSPLSSTLPFPSVVVPHNNKTGRQSTGLSPCYSACPSVSINDAFLRTTACTHWGSARLLCLGVAARLC